MKRKSNKIISILLAVIMITVCLPATAFAKKSGDYSYTLDSSGNASINGFNSDVSGDVIMPEEIDGHAIAAIAYRAFRYCGLITSITIPETVTRIGDEAFLDCKLLKSININENNSVFCSQDGVVFNKEKTELIICSQGNPSSSYAVPDGVTIIAASAFYDCKLITNITIPADVTRIEESAFYGCVNISDVCYGGTAEQWKSIRINSGNDSLTSASIHFNSSQHASAWSDWTITTPATCTKTGVESRTCTVCGTTETQAIDALGHNYSSEWTVDKKPSCIGSGSKSHHCTRCDAITDKTVIPPVEHSFTKWIELSPATWLTEGAETRICSVCGVTEKRVIPKVVMTNEIKDEKSGISVLYKDDSFDGEIKLNVEQEFDGESYQLVKDDFKYFKFELFDIFVTYDDEKVEPNGSVIVKIPVPNNYGTDKLAVYYVTTDKTLKKVTFIFEDGYVYIETSDFCEYLLVDGNKMSDAETTTEKTTIPVTNPPETTKPVQETTTVPTTKPTTEATTASTTKPTTEVTTSSTTKPTTEDTTASTTKPTTEATTASTTKPTTETISEDTSTAPEFILGDVNGDGKVDASDARLALRISAGLENATDSQLLAADVDKNKELTASDARKILRVSANLDTF